MDKIPGSSATTRRRFLLASAAVAGATLTAACAPASAPTATPAPAAKPAPAAAAPTAAPAATAPTAAAAKPAAAPTAVPAAAAAATPAVAAKPAAGPAPKQVARNKTLIVSFHGSGNYTESEIWSPYCIGGTHQHGAGLFYEPVAFYSAFADKTHPWLVESWKYSADFKELTMTVRSGITWSDGKPFSAEDIAYTLNTLKSLGAKVNRGVDTARFVDSAQATNPTTVVVKFTAPAPRFFYYMTYKYDIGVYMVPKHIFDGQDWPAFTHFDFAKDWPVTTAPWRVVATSPTQKLIDRRDDWWAVKAGVAQALPAMERIIFLPNIGDSQLAQSMITNQIDKGGIFQIQTIKATVTQNPKITTHAGRESPYGYVDWWPLSLYVNCEKPPFNDPDVRWAISYFLDRQQMVDVAYQGATSPSMLPMPTYPGLMPYFDTVKDLFETYPTTKLDLAKGTEMLQSKGFTKNGSGAWMDPTGQPFKFEIIGLAFLSNLGPVVAEQLKRQGIDVTFTMPPDASQRFTNGDYVASIFGHGGSVSGDPFFTLNLFQTASQFVPGQPPSNRNRWSNQKYNDVVDQIYLTPTEDATKLKGLFHEAMEVWLPELPEIQLVEFYHYIAMNQHYWTNWPTKDNAYINGCSWHLTFPLVLKDLQATNA